VAEPYEALAHADYLRLIGGEPELVERLQRPGRFELPTGFTYPGRGPMSVFVVTDGSSVRLSEGGHLLRYLEGQGMDMSLDLVISKTVFHAVQGVGSTSIGSGQIGMETVPERVPQDLPRFVQLVIEIVGLRHSKYKDALVQLSRAYAPSLHFMNEP
jgi:Domain of unknown function DUF1828